MNDIGFYLGVKIIRTISATEQELLDDGSINDVRELRNQIPVVLQQLIETMPKEMVTNE